jgi:hypothetical protein
MIREKTMYETDDGEFFPTAVAALAHGRVQVLSVLLDNFMGTPTMAGLAPKEKTMIRHAIQAWEKVRPVETTMQLMVDEKNKVEMKAGVARVA